MQDCMLLEIKQGDMHMTDAFPDPKLGAPFLLTPGPLSTAFSVKAAMLKHWGSWGDAFRAIRRMMRWWNLVGHLD